MAAHGQSGDAAKDAQQSFANDADGPPGTSTAPMIPPNGSVPNVVESQASSESPEVSQSAVPPDTSPNVESRRPSSSLAHLLSDPSVLPPPPPSLSPSARASQETPPSPPQPPPRRVYVANLLVTLPNSGQSTQSQISINLRLSEPASGQQPVESSNGPVIEVPLEERDISFVGSTSHHAQPLTHPQSPSHARTLSAASSIASSSMTHHTPSAPLISGQATSIPGHPTRSEPTPSTIAAATASLQTPLHDIPAERLVPPSIRPPGAEQLAKAKITTALKESRQWAGSRPAPLTQVDRFLNRIDLFVKLHSAIQYTADPAAGERQEDMPIVYWADLLKFGGLGSAWNEKKGRRAYKVIYSDLLSHQQHPLIRAFLEHERWKTMDDLEAAFDDLYGRKRAPPPESPAAVKSESLNQLPPTMTPNMTGHTAPASVASDVPEDDALLDLAETGRAAPQLQVPPPAIGHPTPQAASPGPALSPIAAAVPPVSRKRKLDAVELEPIPELVPVPTERLNPPPSREDDSSVRAGIVETLVKAGQWAGSRPAVISSLASLVHRVLLLIRIHAAETIGPDNKVVYWSDCVRFGGVAQAWNSRKANRQAFKKTYADLVRFQSNPMVQQLFANSATTDIKAAEVVLARLTLGSAPASTSPAPSTRQSSPPVASKRRSTPEWSESPPDLNGVVADEPHHHSPAKSFAVAQDDEEMDSGRPEEIEDVAMSPDSEVDELEDS